MLNINVKLEVEADTCLPFCGWMKLNFLFVCFLMVKIEMKTWLLKLLSAWRSELQEQFWNGGTNLWNIIRQQHCTLSVNSYLKKVWTWEDNQQLLPVCYGKKKTTRKRSSIPKNHYDLLIWVLQLIVITVLLCYISALQLVPSKIRLPSVKLHKPLETWSPTEEKTQLCSWLYFVAPCSSGPSWL